MEYRFLHFILFILFLTDYTVAQKNGQITSRIYTLLGVEDEVQIPAYRFKDWATDEEVYLSFNDVLEFPNHSQSLKLEELERYKSKDFIIDFIYLKHLCSEGVEGWPCSGWVVCGITPCSDCPKSIGGHQVPKNLKIPQIGYLEDPDGYVNVRAQMNVQSPVVSVLDFYEGEYFYFFECPDKNWYLYYGYNFKGYVHASRVRLI